MSARICVSMTKSTWKTFALHFPIVIPCLHERMVGICVSRSPAPICIYRPRPSIFVCLFFVLHLKFVQGCVIVTVSICINSASNCMYFVFRLMFDFLEVRLSRSRKNSFYLLQWKSFKNDEKCFLAHLKSYFRSQDIYIFVLTFWSCRKNDLIRKIRLISKFMTWQPG